LRLANHMFVRFIYEMKIFTYISVLGFKLAIVLGLAAFVGKNVDYIKIEICYSIYLIFLATKKNSAYILQYFQIIAIKIYLIPSFK